MFTQYEKMAASGLCLVFAVYFFVRLQMSRARGVFDVTDNEFDAERKYVRESSEPKEYRTQEIIHIVVIAVLLLSVAVILLL